MWTETTRAKYERAGLRYGIALPSNDGRVADPYIGGQLAV